MQAQFDETLTDSPSISRAPYHSSRFRLPLSFSPLSLSFSVPLPLRRPCSVLFRLLCDQHNGTASTGFPWTTASPGGAKFTWPPAKAGGPVTIPGGGEAPLGSTATPSVPTYRPPPGTQRVTAPSGPGTPKFGSQTPSSTQHFASSPFCPPMSAPSSVPAAPLPSSYSPVPSPASSRPASFMASPVGSPGVVPGLGQAKVPPPTAPKPPSTQFRAPQGPPAPPATFPKPKVANGTPWSGAGSGGPGSASFTGTSGLSQGAGSRPAPKRGRGKLSQQAALGGKIPICSSCGSPIRYGTKQFGTSGPHIILSVRDSLEDRRVKQEH